MLVKDAALLKGTERFQVMGSKCKKVASSGEERQQPSKKARGKQLEKYYRSIAVKIVDANHCERYVYAKQDCLVYYLRWVMDYFHSFF